MHTPPSPATDHGPHDLSIAEAGRLMADGTLSAIALTEACLERIGLLGSSLNAFICVLTDSALVEARAADERLQSGRSRGPLDGIPIALKDNCDTAGVPTTAGSTAYRSRVPTEDAGCVRRLRAAGAVIIGKTNLNEFAHAGDGTNEAFGSMHNPWALDRSPGGSSGGSAAAVAAGLCLAALGTDTRGSVRIPAALCGVTGHRPTFGRVGRGGVIPRALTFDTVGPLARDAQGVAAVLAALIGPDSRDSEALHTDGLRAAAAESDLADLVIGAPDEDTLAVCEDAVRDNFLASVELLRELGAEVRSFAPPAVDGQVTAGIAAVELASYLRADFAKQPGAFGTALRAELERGTEVTAFEYIDWLEYRRRIEYECDVLARECDAWVTPTVAATAWPLAGNARPALGPFTLWPSAGHLPATSIANGLDGRGLPTALQIVAPRFGDETCLRIATAFQAVSDFHRARPSVSAASGDPETR